MIRVLIADDHQLVRQGIRALLEKGKDIQVIGEARDGQEAIEKVEKLNPDVLLMDLSMPTMNGNKATEKIRELGFDVKVIILSMYSDEILVREALHHGARGYLLKHGSRDELIAAIRAVYEGKQFFSAAVSEILPQDLVDADTSHTNPPG